MTKMTLEDLLNKRCVLGLSYYGIDKRLMHQVEHAGTVTHIDKERGISLRLDTPPKPDKIVSDQEPRVFAIPPLLTPWFRAPQGHYRDSQGAMLIKDPDFIVTWDVYQTQQEKQGDHEWWEWVPRTTAPAVNQRRTHDGP